VEVISAYIEPIKIAVLVFPFLALAISAIFFIIQYRRYGRFVVSRALILYSFIFYLLCAYFLVILPLPSIEEVAKLTGPSMELTLGASVQNFLKETVLDIHRPQTYLTAMKQSVFLEPVFNVLLTLPFGIYLRYYFKKSFKQTVLLTFCLSLFFELTQLTGLYFIYPRSYRLFDVNDLLHNTLGGILGYFITPIFTFLLPTREEIDERSYAKGTEVTYIRRGVAWGIDWLFIGFLMTLITIVLRLFTNDYTITLDNNLIVYFVQIFLYFICLPYLTNGQTLGKKIVRIRIIGDNTTRLSFKALFQRYGLLYMIYFALSRISLALVPGIQSDDYFQIVVSVLLSLMIFAIQAMFVINISWAIIRKNRRLFYEKISHTHTISTIKKRSA
jgi:glycopeptide antibiotics resistance protein